MHFKTKPKNLAYVLILGIMGIWAACQSDSSQSGNNEQDSLLSQDVDSAEIATTKALTLPYEVVFNDDTDSLEITPNPGRSPVELNKEELAEAINIKYQEIVIEIKELRGDTLDVRIADPTYLTQSFGSAGARAYLAEVTYAFTELPEINVVHFDFKEGDHAFPGDYSRANFQSR